jgi:hypothetical protein
VGSIPEVKDINFHPRFSDHSFGPKIVQRQRLGQQGKREPSFLVTYNSFIALGFAHLFVPIDESCKGFFILRNNTLCTVGKDIEKVVGRFCLLCGPESS